MGARPGKDLVSSLCSGLLTIGPRFGGALDDAARQFTGAHDAGTAPKDFIDGMKKRNQLVMGIGHRIKSLANPDQRVEIIKKFAKSNFASTEILDYALAVEQSQPRNARTSSLTWTAASPCPLWTCFDHAAPSPRRRHRTSSTLAASTASSCLAV